MVNIPGIGSSNGKHHWKFFRAGGLDQVVLESGADLLALDELDQKLWVALSCPTKGLEFDTKTLEMLDTDKDGRIRVPEILAAIKWAALHLKNPDDLLKAVDGLPLNAINDSHDSGRKLLASAREILKSLGKGDATAVTVADATDTAKIYASTRFNGDGIIPPASATAEETKKVIEEIITILGGEPDRSGAGGINQERADKFFSELQGYSDWWKKAKSEGAAMLPLGDHTPAAFEALQAVRCKIDDYFSRCRLAAFDPRATGPLNRTDADFVLLAQKDISANAIEAAAFPIARIEPDRPLPLHEGVNPAWTAALAKFEQTVIVPLLGAGKTTLAAAEWESLKARLATYEAWQSSKQGTVVEKLGIERIEQILAGNTRADINSLIAEDKALEPAMNEIACVDKLARLYRDLYPLLNNFVSMPSFYALRDKAIFQVGTLYLDGRSCDLCVRVDDMAKHATMALLSKMYLAYCDCTRKVTGEKMTIAAAFTAGDSDNLMVGRNGLFYDRRGNDWDASIIKIVENPISIWQAFWSPYKKFARFIEELVTKRAAAAETSSMNQLTAAATTAEKAAATGKPADAKPKFDTGMIAALGVGAAGLGGMIGGAITGFLQLGPWMPVGFLGIILLISLPSMLLAWLKLRKRNLGPILDANGWAINGFVKINFLLGKKLTQMAELPVGAERSLDDPFEDKRAKQRRFMAMVILLGALGFTLYFTEFPEWLGEKLVPPSTAKIIRHAPAAKAP